MPNPTIAHITTPAGTVYDLKDAQARSDIESIQRSITGGISFIGQTTTEITDQSTTNPITISGESHTAVEGNLVVYGSKEFVFDGTKWIEFGDLGSLGTLAFKNSASGSFTPAGNVSVEDPTVVLSTENKYVASSETGGGSVSAGRAAQCTLPSLGMTVQNENLAFSWSDGNFTPNVPTGVTLPSFSLQSIATGVESATSGSATFTGTLGTVNVE